MIFHPNIARCVGLWLAEGDSKTHSEITFTNNCLQLVKFFEETIQKIFPRERLKSRVYVYSPKIVRLDLPLLSRINQYTDARAKRPYYIYRLAKRSLVKRWKELVRRYVTTKEMYPYILQGFFAGEGNIKFHRASHSRTIRIAQGTRNKLLEIILKELDIKSRFSSAERAYVITGRMNLNKLAKLEIITLHPEKCKKFNEMLATYRQDHYPRYYFKKKIYAALKNPYSSLGLARMFNRSIAHAQETLKMLKDEGKVQNFRIKSRAFWVRTDQNVILLSCVKREYLRLLKKNRKLITAFVARKLNVDWYSAYRRLKELEKLKLVKRGLDGGWKLCATSKRIQILT
jgi:predicted transcriptional regulator